jgi:signal transduction histidine kinase
MSARLLEDKRIGDLSPEQTELVKSITDDSERLLKITSELLNMAEVEAGKIELKLQPTQPGTIVDQAINAIQFRAGQKNVALKISIPDNLPLMQADVEKAS